MSTELESVPLPQLEPTPRPLDITRQVADVRAGLLRALDELEQRRDDVPALAAGIVVLDALIRDLTELRNTARRYGGSAMAAARLKRAELPGVGVVERDREGGSWVEVDYQRAVQDVVRATIKANDGEVDGFMLVDAITSCFSFSGLKSAAPKGQEPTGLAALGLERASYGRQTDRVDSIRIIGGAK